MREIIQSKRTSIMIDDYNSFHKMHRVKDFDDSASYITLYFLYHFFEYYNKNLDPKINRLVDDKIKALVIYSENDNHHLPPWVTQICFDQLSTVNLEDFEVVINQSDSQSHPFTKYNTGVDSKIQSGELKLSPETIYISFRSSAAKKKKPLPMFSLNLVKSFINSGPDKDTQEPPVESKINFGILQFKSFSSVRNVRAQIPYGPWPLYHIDFSWKTYPDWPSIKELKDLKKKS